MCSCLEELRCLFFLWLFYDGPRPFDPSWPSCLVRDLGARDQWAAGETLVLTTWSWWFQRGPEFDCLAQGHLLV